MIGTLRVAGSVALTLCRLHGPDRCGRSIDASPGRLSQAVRSEDDLPPPLYAPAGRRLHDHALHTCAERSGRRIC